MEIKKVKIWSLVKIAVLFGLVFGLIWGIISSVYISIMANNILSQYSSPEMASLIQQTYGTDPAELANTWKSASKIIWLTFTITSVVVSFIASLLCGVFYNLFAKWVGGIKIEFADKKK